MCNNDFILLHVSNRGSNVMQMIANEKYAVNIPSDIRRANTAYKITVISGIVQASVSAALDAYAELGVLCNLRSGHDTEVSTGYNAGPNNILFHVDLPVQHITAAGDIPLQTSRNHEFVISYLPEKLEFSRYAVVAGIKQGVALDKYISFTLKIQYIDKDLTKEN